MSFGSGSEAPEWLYSSLDSALVSIGATAGPAARRAELERLVEAWNTSGRSFHNARYLGSVLEHLDTLEAASTDPQMLRVAYAYRGAEHEVGWEDSGEGSDPVLVPSMCATDGLLELGVPAESIERVNDLIDQLSHHTPKPDDIDAKIIIDADLAILASPPQQYRKLLQGLKNEVPFLDSEDFLKRRRRAIKRLLARRNIFFSPIGKRWDDVARENLEAELGLIDHRLSPVEDDPDPIPVDDSHSDKVVIRRSIRSWNHATGALPVAAERAKGAAIDSAPDEDADDKPSPGRDDDVSSTSTLEVLPDIFDAIRHHHD